MAQNAFVGQNPDCVTIGAPGSINSTEAIPPPSAPNINALSSITGLAFVPEAPNFKSALIQQFNLQVEQQVGANVFTIGYVGNIGQHLPEVFNDLNVPKPFSTNAGDPNFGTGARPLGTLLPLLSSVGVVATEGYSNYNGLQ